MNPRRYGPPEYADRCPIRLDAPFPGELPVVSRPLPVRLPYYVSKDCIL